MKLIPRQIAESFYLALEDKFPNPQTIRNFWKFLQRKKLTRQLDKILLAFQAVHQQKNPILTITLESARELPPDVKQQIRSKLEKKYPQKKIQLESIINPDLIGGIKITTPFSQLDLSIKNQLLKLQEQI